MNSDQLSIPVSPATDGTEEPWISTLRAQNWDEFVGQDHIKTALTIAISAAKQRNEAVDHTLFYGPPGLGKTTLAHLIGKEMGSSVKVTSGTALTKVGDVAALISNLEANDVLFIDEIHRLPKAVEETLYPVMEDFALDIMIGKGTTARSMRLEIPRFTLVGATTRFGALAGPFRDRFGMIHKLNHYEPHNLQTIIEKASHKLNLVVSESSSLALAQRARGTPRIALQLLKRVRDVAQLQNQAVTPELISEALDLLRIDHRGLGDHDRQFLQTIISKHHGGPVGLTTIAATLNEDPGTIEEIIEPFLLQLGFLTKTPRGRVVSETAYQHLGLAVPKNRVE